MSSLEFGQLFSAPSCRQTNGKHLTIDKWVRMRIMVLQGTIFGRIVFHTCERLGDGASCFVRVSSSHCSGNQRNGGLGARARVHLQCRGKVEYRAYMRGGSMAGVKYRRKKCEQKELEVEDGSCHREASKRLRPRQSPDERTVNNWNNLSVKPLKCQMGYYNRCVGGSTMVTHADTILWTWYSRVAC